MKLRNKKTGEIIEFDAILPVKDVSGDSVAHLEYNSLNEFNEEWEDCEEPKKDGLDNIIALVEAYSSNDSERYPKEIVEKLKAWKRLKDKGFVFNGINMVDGSIKTGMPLDDCEGFYDDMKLLFGGEE